MGKLQDKVAIITGAAGGIGAAAARLFAQEGAAVVVADIDEAGGKRVAGAIREAGGRALFVHTDIADEAQVQRLIARAVEHFGGLHIMYNNAGFEIVKKAHELSPAEWQRQIDVNLSGTYWGCKYAIHHFLDVGGGVLLNTSSISGFLPSPGRPAYNAAKGGIIMLTRQLAGEYGPSNIRANAICPGITMTGMTQGMLYDPAIMQLAGSRTSLKRVAAPEEVARPALFLCSDDASYITGIALYVDGGMTLGGYWP